MDKVYIDTNTFLDALLDRNSRNGINLGTPAMRIFSQAKHGGFKIIVSNWTLQQPGKHIETEKVKELFSDIGEEQIIRCICTEEQKEKAKSPTQWRTKETQKFISPLQAPLQVLRCRNQISRLVFPSSDTAYPHFSFLQSGS